MKSPQEIIIKPIITEHSTDGLADGVYTFEVNKHATKPEIRQAVEKLFGVKVLKVNTINVRGKEKRMGYTKGHTPSIKKAMVTIDLEPGQETYLGEGGKEVSVDRKYKTSIEELGIGQ